MSGLRSGSQAESISVGTAHWRESRRRKAVRSRARPWWFRGLPRRNAITVFCRKSWLPTQMGEDPEKWWGRRNPSPLISCTSTTNRELVGPEVITMTGRGQIFAERSTVTRIRNKFTIDLWSRRLFHCERARAIRVLTDLVKPRTALVGFTLPPANLHCPRTS